MGLSPWCFDPDTQKLGDLPAAAEAYKQEIEIVHTQFSDDGGWERLMVKIAAKEYPELKTVIERPARATEGAWWDLADPDCWGYAAAAPKEYLKNYDLTDEIRKLNEVLSSIYSTTYSKVVDGVAISTLNAEQDSILTELSNPSGVQNLTLFQIQEKLEIVTNTITIDQILSNEYENAYNDAINAGADPLTAHYAGTAAKEEARKISDEIEPVDAVAREKVLDAVSAIREKIDRILCPDITNFKAVYEQAVLRLSQPHVEELVRQTIAAAEADQSLLDYASDVGNILTGALDEVQEMYAQQARAILNEIQNQVQNALRDDIEEEFADNVAYSHQCFLMRYMDELIDKKVELDRRFATAEHTNGLLELPYFRKPHNAPIRMMGEPFGFLNKLTVDSTQSAFFDIDNKTLSSLIPHLRLFKVEAGEDGRDVETEITFDANGYDSIFSGSVPSKNAFRKQRGHGVGMKSFNFSYDGTDPFSAKKMISAKLSLHASTFDELLRDRESPSGGFYKYAELALKTGGVTGKKKEKLSETEKKNLEKLNFRLKATVGWTADNSVMRKLPPESEIKKAIYNSYITIYLTPTIHNFSFDETGAVTFDIEYLAYIEDAFSQSTYNIFAELAKEKKARELVYNYFENMGCDVDARDDFKTFRDKDEKLVSDINQQAFSRITGKLHEKDKIYYLSFSRGDTEKLLRNPTDTTVKFPEILTPEDPADTSNEIVRAAKTAQKIADGVGETEAILSAVAVSQEDNNVPFFYFNDLMGAVMELIEEQLLASSYNPKEGLYYKNIFNLGVISKFDEIQIKKIDLEAIKQNKNKLEQFRKMRVILGPMEMFNPVKSDKTILCSIGEIPISMSYFIEFMSERVNAKDILSYPFGKFIKDFINDLITNFLNSDSCSRVDKSQRLKLNSTTVCAYNRNDLGSDKRNGQQIDDITAQITNIMERRSPILLLGGHRNTPEDQLTSDRMTSYFVFTIGRKSPISNYLGNKSQDEARGVFHYIIGKDKGFVKNITLEKTTANGLKEVRFEQEGYNGLEQLREVYNSTIETFLNVQTFPGVYVYVDPDGFAPNVKNVDLTRYGIGGYSMVVKTEHKIAPGVADTTLHTVWVASKAGDPEKNKD
ncbi:MAG TPA: hypothetical protein DF712_01910, partial [Balneola sp.]|nr:hypothetical protein [Balneola sp.]